MFERLVAACPEPPAVLIQDRAEHNDFLDTGRAKLDQAILDLVKKAVVEP